MRAQIEDLRYAIRDMDPEIAIETTFEEVRGTDFGLPFVVWLISFVFRGTGSAAAAGASCFQSSRRRRASSFGIRQVHPASEGEQRIALFSWITLNTVIVGTQRST